MRANRLSWVFLAALAAGFIFCAAQSSLAENPDLVIESLQLPAEAKEGDPVKDISVTVKNQGNAAVCESRVRLTCEPTDKSCRCSCPQSLNMKTYPVPAIIAGSKVTISIPTLPDETWKSHDYVITAAVDPENLIPEADEANNAKSVTVPVKLIYSHPKELNYVPEPMDWEPESPADDQAFPKMN